MGSYTYEEFLDTFGGPPERDDPQYAGPDPDLVREEDRQRRQEAEWTIHVVGFVTEGGVGGFEWRVSLHEAERAARYLEGPGVQMTNVRAVTVPGDLEHPDDVTRWLDARAELWEPTA